MWELLEGKIWLEDRNGRVVEDVVEAARADPSARHEDTLNCSVYRCLLTRFGILRA